jgi:hypothetical protein
MVEQNPDDNTLSLAYSRSNFDSALGNFDSALGNFDDLGRVSVAYSGSYYFSNFIDMGSVYQSRISIGIVSTSFNAFSTFDTTAGLFDSCPGLFESSDGDVLVEFYVSTTNDNPNGSPTWSAFKKCITGDFTCRAYRIRVDLTAILQSSNIKISQLSASVSLPNRVEPFTNQTFASGGSTFTYSKPFFHQPSFQYDYNTSNGDSIQLTHVMSGSLYTGVTVQVSNGGSGVARTGNLFASGY